MKPFWTTEDVLKGECSLAMVGCNRPDYVEPAVVELVPVDRSPEAMRRAGVDALIRLSQGRDANVAFKAAVELLNRVEGRVPLPARLEPPQPPEPAPVDPAAMLPSWLQRPDS